MLENPQSLQHESNDFTNFYLSESHKPRSNSVGTLISALLSLLYLTYTILYHYNFITQRPTALLQYIVTYIIPDTILNLLDPVTTEDGHEEKTTDQKIEQMRRILRMDSPTNVSNLLSRIGKRALSASTRLPDLSLLTSNERVNTRPSGLGNDDNSCYQNSILQGLAALDTLSPYLDVALEKHQHKNSTPDISTGDDVGADHDIAGDIVYSSGLTMTYALRMLIGELKGEGAQTKSRLWTPLPLKNMDSYQQQDAQEYFSRLMDEVDREIAKTSTTNRGSMLPTFTSIATNALKPDVKTTLQYKGLQNPLEGLIAQKVGCTACGYSEGLNMIPFNNLTLPLGHARQYSVSQCLDEYTKVESIDGVECNRCTMLKLQSQLSTIQKRLNETKIDTTNDRVLATATTRLSAIQTALHNDDFEDKTLRSCGISNQNKVKSVKTKQIVIARPPKSLVVHVQRSMFDEYFNPIKNLAIVRFPDQLDLARWCLGSTDMDPSTVERIERWQLDPEHSIIGEHATVKGPIYKLKAVVSHSGRHENGHYICYRRHPQQLCQTDHKSSKLKSSDDTAIDNMEDEETASNESYEQWWRFSDDDVSRVDESIVQNQGGVFMLFYDCIEGASEIQSDNTLMAKESFSAKTDGIHDTEQESLTVTHTASTSVETSVVESDDDGDFLSPIEPEHQPVQPIIVPSMSHQARPRPSSKSREQNASNGMIMV